MRKISIFLTIIFSLLLTTSCVLIKKNVEFREEGDEKTFVSELNTTETKASEITTAASKTKEDENLSKNIETTVAVEETSRADKGEDMPKSLLNQGRDVEYVDGSRQSKLMLDYTAKKWSPTLEDAMADVDFSIYGLDVKEPTLISDVNDLFVLANKANYFPEDFVPINLFRPSSPHAGSPERGSLRDIAANAIDDLHYAAADDGLEIKTVSSYRSIAYQKDLFSYYANRDGEEVAATYSSRPGYSEHHTGLCTDVSSPVMGFELDASYGDTAEGEWIAENAYKYGFVVRYPQGKDDLTGYTYEPWHLRYLGIPLATYLHETGLCYEEFIALEKGFTPDEIRIKESGK